MKLEVIATNLDDVTKIAKSNADRIEFCKAMEHGGYTPKYSLVKKCLKVKDTKPIKVMIRNTDKTYNVSKWQYLKMWMQTIRFCHLKKVDGLVFGILNKENEIDINRMGRLVKICKKHNKSITFHRAIDLVPNYDIAFNMLHELGIDTCLTSGGTKSIDDNLRILQKLEQLHQTKVLAGGGITLKNCKKISKVADEIHVGSAIRIDHDWKKSIDIDLINQIKEQIN